MGRGHEGKVAVVTGGASGIGQAYARRLAEDGADVAIADVASAEETESIVTGAGRRAMRGVCDVSSPEEVERFAGDVGERFGRCDILANNAGIYPFMSFEDMEYEQWRQVMSVNLDSMFFTCKAFVPGMKERGYGRIVNVTSNAVAPSLVRTPTTEAGPQEEIGLFDFVPQLQAIKRVEAPEDLVGAVSFLTSEDATFITGQTLMVDGGLVRG